MEVALGLVCSRKVKMLLNFSEIKFVVKSFTLQQSEILHFHEVGLLRVVPVTLYVIRNYFKLIKITLNVTGSRASL